ncbi:diacylglycerol/lipid kinase family protein [Lysinibacillus antri]|uniref:diacylglycerol/lipid kinase family protein n=1 Tax=Lysinibacillus antri TaxID=2498145 RepID=UPI001FE9CBCE|nr:YegS/Rv2252/BmrU family lipid kinase [Lysinibacillus antri]
MARDSKKLKIPFSYHVTQYSGHATEIAQTVSQHSRLKNEDLLIIAIGGDGTIHEVINGVIGFSNVFVGSVSAGSGNDFSRGFATFHDVNQIEQFVLNSNRTIQQVDSGVMVLNETIQKSFMNNSGIGFDAFVAYQANLSNFKRRMNKIGLGKLSYVYYVVYSLVNFKLFDLKVSVDGTIKRYENVWFATISNQPYFGGGMKISPNSITNDGLLEMTIVSNLSKVKFLLLFLSVFFGAHTRLKEVHQINGEKFILHAQGETMCHTDGETITMETNETTVEYEVRKKSWNLAN